MSIMALRRDVVAVQSIVTSREPATKRIIKARVEAI
jgi:hypothetical protein